MHFAGAMSLCNSLRVGTHSAERTKHNRSARDVFSRHLLASHAHSRIAAARRTNDVELTREEWYSLFEAGRGRGIPCPVATSQLRAERSGARVLAENPTDGPVVGHLPLRKAFFGLGWDGQAF